MAENTDHHLKRQSRLFNDYAATYGKNPKHAIPKELEGHYRQDLEEVLGSFAQYKSVLEVGAGNGLFTQLLHKWGCEDITGTDIAEVMLEAARARLPQCEFRLLTEEAQPDLFPPASFDLIISRQLACHLIDPIAVFQCWKSWLKPGGRIAIIDGLWTRIDWGRASTERGSLVDSRPLSCTQTTATACYLLTHAGLKVRYQGLLGRVNNFEKEQFEIGQPREPIMRFVVVAS